MGTPEVSSWAIIFILKGQYVFCVHNGIHAAMPANSLAGLTSLRLFLHSSSRTAFPSLPFTSSLLPPHLPSFTLLPYPLFLSSFPFLHDWFKENKWDVAPTSSSPMSLRPLSFSTKILSPSLTFSTTFPWNLSRIISIIVMMMKKKKVRINERVDFYCLFSTWKQKISCAFLKFCIWV